jgi:hydroxyacylglutathione hydrolase
VRERLAQVRAVRDACGFTIPTTIGQELATNLFLRAGSPEELARLRRHKESWRG